ncbi:MAG: hypothetical protein ABSC95_11290 [Acetobacteraceae bacterium]|jgi:hypothetical protein
MSLRPASFCALLLLAGCATLPEPPVAKAQAAPPAGMHGTILAMRPVPAASPGPARLLLSSLGTQGAFVAGHVFEFIVRTEGGTMISIVQPDAIGLHPGERVSIVQGAETRIEAPLTD